MKRPSLRELALWVGGPLAVFVLFGYLGHLRALKQRGAFFDATAALSAPRQKQLDEAAALATANAVWALAPLDAVKRMLERELGRIGDSEGSNRARAFIRHGIIDTNPDGQAAVFSSACSTDPSVCDHLKEATRDQTKLRFVAPGNQLPLMFLEGHPPISGFPH